jgi:hypothetical protein
MTNTLPFFKEQFNIFLAFIYRSLQISERSKIFHKKTRGVEILQNFLFNALNKKMVPVLHHTIIMSKIWQSCLHLYYLCTVFKAATKCLIVSLLS